MTEWNVDDAKMSIVRKIITCSILLLALLLILLLIEKVANNKHKDENENFSIKNNSKYSLNTIIGEYNFKNKQEKKAYMDYILKMIDPKELQRFCKMNDDYLYTLLDLTQYATGNDVMEHMKYFGYNNFFHYIFENTVLEKGLPVTDDFVKKFNKELYDYFGFVVDRDKLSLNITVNQNDRIIRIDEAKIIKEIKDEIGNLLDWETEIYNTYSMKYKLDDTGRIEDIVLDGVNKVLDKNGNRIIAKNSNRFDEHNYIGYIAELSTGKYFYRVLLGTDIEFDDAVSKYCFTKKFLDNNNFEFSILDKDFVNECAENKHANFFEYDFEEPLKHFDKFYRKGYIPVAINNGKIKKHFNVYFKYTDDLYLDDVRVEYLFEEEMGGN